MRQVDVNRLLAAVERIERKLDRLDAARVRLVSWLESESDRPSKAPVTKPPTAEPIS